MACSSSSDFEIWDNIPHNTTPNWKRTSYDQLPLPGQQQLPPPHVVATNRLNNHTTTSRASRSLMNSDQHGQGQGQGGQGGFGSIPIEFIQVLIHQHAKTLVALQDLRNEVKTLSKTDSSSSPSTSSSSAVVVGLNHHLSSSSSSSLHHHHHLHNTATATTTAVTTTSSSQDSGFTEKSKLTNATTTATSSSEESDATTDLYSLLSLIQFKVESLSTVVAARNNAVQTTTPHTAPPTVAAQPATPLGTLDNQLGNAHFDFSKFTKMSRTLIGAVLSCNDNVELKRQLLFTIARLKTLEDHHHNHHGNNKLLTTPPSAAAALAAPPTPPPSEALTRSQFLQLESLKSENASLRQKLQNMEIELEGTNAKLRILNKFKSPTTTPTNNNNNSHHHHLRNSLSATAAAAAGAPTPPTPLARHHNPPPPAALLATPTTTKSTSNNNTTSSPTAAASATTTPTVAAAAVRGEKSLSSLGGSSTSERANRSLIPVPVARVKKKNQKPNNNFWVNWFSGANNNNQTNH